MNQAFGRYGKAVPVSVVPLATTSSGGVEAVGSGFSRRPTDIAQGIGATLDGQRVTLTASEASSLRSLVTPTATTTQVTQSVATPGAGFAAGYAPVETGGGDAYSVVRGPSSSLAAIPPGAQDIDASSDSPMRWIIGALVLGTAGYFGYKWYKKNAKKGKK